MFCMSEHLTHYTQDHEEIREWAEARKAVPSHVASTGSKKDVGLIRLDFPGYSGAGSLEEISWDEWFEKFDKSGLALIYQEHTAAGEQSNFNKLVAHDPEEEKKHGKKPAKTHAAKSHAKH